MPHLIGSEPPPKPVYGAPKANIAPPRDPGAMPPAIDRISMDLDEISQRTAIMLNRLMAKLDDVMGAEPPMASTGTSPTPVPTSKIGSIEEKLGDIKRSLTWLHNQLDRLDAVL